MGDAQHPDQSSWKRPASMWKYAGVFLGVYGAVAVVVGVLVNNYGVTRPAWLGIVAMVLAANVVGLVFAKRHRRLFHQGERRFLTAACLLIVLAFEWLGYVGHPEYFQSLPLSWLVGTFLFTIILDALVTWAAFRYAVTRTMARQLEAGAGGSPLSRPKE